MCVCVCEFVSAARGHLCSSEEWLTSDLTAGQLRADNIQVLHGCSGETPDLRTIWSTH